ncbi:MAG: GTP-binding protein, partial [Campylobacter sp.]|nr:GTP-binding protein [Campylobacter sp.]
MQTVIIGTSGHIDHGKTALIRALNGFEGDELQDEKERGITINLSFSNLKGGENNIAFIDVPGHENLVKTMISGAYGFDVCMLVVSCDDGLMPQSKEHIAILSLLGIKSIILCITKCDLCDTARANEVLKECENFIKNFSNLQILNSFFLSIKDQNSINELKNYLFTLNPKPRNAD